MVVEIKNFLNNKAKEILYICYKYDMSFPRSCSVVSNFLAYSLYEDENMRNQYETMYIRGHYRDDEEFCECDEIEDGYHCPIDCSCDHMMGHSWLEIKDKATESILLVDFTVSQFSEDFSDLQSEILDSGRFSPNSLFALISKYGDCISSKINSNYVKGSKSVKAEHIFDTVNETLLSNEITPREYWETKAFRAN